jgi:hypothetical protein
MYRFKYKTGLNILQKESQQKKKYLCKRLLFNVNLLGEIVDTNKEIKKKRIYR